MILLLKPKGRGNWTQITMKIDAPADLFPQLRGRPVMVGMLIEFAGLTLRVCEVVP